MRCICGVNGACFDVVGVRRSFEAHDSAFWLRMEGVELLRKKGYRRPLAPACPSAGLCAARFALRACISEGGSASAYSMTLFMPDICDAGITDFTIGDGAGEDLGAVSPGMPGFLEAAPPCAFAMVMRAEGFQSGPISAWRPMLLCLIIISDTFACWRLTMELKLLRVRLDSFASQWTVVLSAMLSWAASSPRPPRAQRAREGAGGAEGR
mmetsp:Transcript_123862/g.336374  ORF Transcript_123862/g.336374 Transcript_123862/m.336374 type:complete len:210 (-) Transcript_123862:26-655(-)